MTSDVQIDQGKGVVVLAAVSTCTFKESEPYGHSHTVTGMVSTHTQSGLAIDKAQNAPPSRVDHKTTRHKVLQ